MVKFDFQITQIIENDAFITKFTNSTPYDCFIQVRPIPPKRKYRTILLIQNETFLLIDQTPIDLTSINIIFDKV